MTKSKQIPDSGYSGIVIVEGDCEPDLRGEDPVRPIWPRAWFLT